MAQWRPRLTVHLAVFTKSPDCENLHSSNGLESLLMWYFIKSTDFGGGLA